MKYQKLLEPLTIRSLTIPNRMVVSAMVTNYANEDGTTTEKYIAYHEEKARGGWGLVITENYTVTRDGGGFKAIPSLWTDDLIDNHRQFTDRVHKAGGKIVAQIYHAGRETNSGITGVRPIGPSAVKDPTQPEIPTEMTTADIEEMVRSFGDCASRVKASGFDGVEIHGAHGYLISAFVSPFSNKRCDHYGGTIENRARFALEIVREVRRRVGDDFPIFYRMSAVEYVEGGLQIEDAKVLARLLEGAGVDCIHCSQGVYTSTFTITPPAITPKAAYANNAAEIKSVVSIPVITVGRITDPEMAETILLSGKADLVAMARASLADPALPKKVAEGRSDEIIRCIGCRQGCAARNSIGKKVLCLVNPMTGMEDTYRFEPLQSKKNVLVAGGGISGCAAAIAAARRGCRVALYEQSERLGGQWIPAAVPVGKAEFATLVQWQAGELARLGVTVHLSTRLTTQLAVREKPDVIIDATGSKPLVPPIRGLDSADTVFAVDLLLGKRSAGKRVAVIGGGMVGAELADHLAVHGSEATIFEMLPDIGQDAEAAAMHFLKRNLTKYGVEVYTSTKVLEIHGGTIIAERDGKRQEFTGFDMVALAAGMVKNTALAEELGGYRVIPVGDAAGVKNGFENIQQAFAAGYQID